MALDFPSNPINGQAYGSYIYNSTVGAWQSKEDPATVATVSTAAPASANPGDFWYDSDDGTSYMYYNDGTSSQWVELLSSGLPLLSTKANLSGATFTGNISAPQLISTATTGTTPLTIASTTLVSNLNADLLDGNHASAFSPVAGSSSITTVGTVTSGTWNGTTLAVANGGTGTTTGTLSDTTYKRIVNPDGGVFTTTNNPVTGAIRVVLPVGWTSHMHKFNVSVFDYNTGKSFDVVVAGYNYSGGTWVNPTAYIVGNQASSLNYTVRFGYTAGGKACVYIGETTSTWNYPQVSVNNVLVGFGGSSTSWLSGWVVDFVTAFESVTQTINNTQIVGGLVPIIPASVGVNAGTATINANGIISISGVTTLDINTCFSTTYENYRVVWRGISNGNTGIGFRLRSGSTTESGAIYGFTGFWYGTRGSSSNITASSTNWGGIFGHDKHAWSGDIIGPMSPNPTGLVGAGFAWATSDNATEAHNDSGMIRNSTQYNGLTFLNPSGGTLTGNLSIYGYRA